jgi:hypothetical protein
MKLKSKPAKRAAAVPAPRAPVAAARTARGPDLGDRRLQLLLGAKRER